MNPGAANKWWRRRVEPASKQADARLRRSVLLSSQLYPYARIAAANLFNFRSVDGGHHTKLSGLVTPATDPTGKAGRTWPTKQPMPIGVCVLRALYRVARLPARSSPALAPSKPYRPNRRFYYTTAKPIISPTGWWRSASFLVPGLMRGSLLQVVHEEINSFGGNHQRQNRLRLLGPEQTGHFCDSYGRPNDSED